MVNQLNKFSPHLADHMKPLHDLLSNHIHWRWEASKETAFHNVKAALTSGETLCAFNCNLGV